MSLFDNGLAPLVGQRNPLRKTLLLAITIFVIGMLSSCVGSSGAHVGFAAFNCPSTSGVSSPVVTGVRQVYGTVNNAAYVTGLYMNYTRTFLYNGPVTGGGTCTAFTFPAASITYSDTGTTLPATVSGTNLYGPDSSSIIGAGNVVTVGSFTQTGSINPITNVGYQYGLLYQGLADGSTAGGYTQIVQPSRPPFLTTLETGRGVTVINTIAHSNSGGFVVAPYNTSEDLVGAFARTSIYKISNGTYYRFDNPNEASISITAYGGLVQRGHELCHHRRLCQPKHHSCGVHQCGFYR